MSPAKRKARKPARKPPAKAARKPARRARKVPHRKAAPKKRAAPRRAATPAKPAPPPWTADIRDLNEVWYSVTDWERAKKFYGETLGLPVALASEEMGWIEYGTALPHLAIGRSSQVGPLPAGGGAIAVLSCPDVRATMAKLQAEGVRCGEVQEIPGMVILGTFYDPDGNKLQLAQSLSP